MGPRAHDGLSRHFAKRVANGFTHWVDRHVKLYSLLFFAGILSTLGGIGYGLFRLVRTFMG